MRIRQITTTANLPPWDANLREYWQDNGNLCDRLTNVPLPLTGLPGPAFQLKICYQLDTPYYSGRDRAGCEKSKNSDKSSCHHNRLCRDWVTGQPMIKGSAWKHLFYRKFTGDNDLKQLLFGAKGEDGSAVRQPGGKGRLKFSRSFFSGSPGCMTTMLINPRVPDTGKGSHPITYEAVKAATRTTLTISYYPPTAGQQPTMAILANLLGMVMRTEGENIGAKQSAGWGGLRLVNICLTAGGELEKFRQEEIRDLAGNAGFTDNQIEIR